MVTRYRRAIKVAAMLTVAADPDCGKQTLRLSGPRFTLETNITLRGDRMTLANPNHALKGKRQ